MILGDSLWSNTSNGTLELVPRRILELVGDFCHAKSPSFGLGRTGLTGRGFVLAVKGSSELPIKGVGTSDEIHPIGRGPFVGTCPKFPIVGSV